MINNDKKQCATKKYSLNKNYKVGKDCTPQVEHLSAVFGLYSILEFLIVS